MSALGRIGGAILNFVVNYCHHHAHPANAALHLVGVPMLAVGLFRLVTGRPAAGLSLIAVSYLLQFLGHTAQGNEVGEVTLIKRIYGRLHGPA